MLVFSLQTLNIFENLLSFKNACLEKESDERLHPSFPSFARRMMQYVL